MERVSTFLAEGDVLTFFSCLEREGSFSRDSGFSPEGMSLTVPGVADLLEVAKRILTQY